MPTPVGPIPLKQAMGTFFFDERLIDDEQGRIDNEVDAFTPHDCADGSFVTNCLDVTCRCLMELASWRMSLSQVDPI